MGKAKSHVPEGLRTVTAHLTTRNAEKEIEFCRQAFGAEVRSVSKTPDGRAVVHADVKIGDSVIFIADEAPGSPSKAPASCGGTTVVLSLYFPDVDAVFARATAAGAKVVMPVGDMFWGDRYGQIQDPEGHQWAIATHTEDLTREEMDARGKAFFEQMAKTGGTPR